jgi:hypothetical protein
MVGPFVLSCQLTGDHYRNLLLNGLLCLLEDMPLAVRESTRFMRESTVVYFSRDVCCVLNSTYNRWIGTEGPTCLALPPKQYIHGAQSFLRRRESLSYSKISQHFLETESSVSCSQKLSATPYPEPHQYSL